MMAEYDKHTWEDYEQIIDAEKLNHIEDGIGNLVEDVNQEVDDREAAVKSLSDELAQEVTDRETADNSLSNSKLDKSGGDSEDVITTFDSDDSASPTGYSDFSVLSSGETHKSLFNKISTMAKNVRWLFSKLGTTDISSIGDGTVTGAINELNNGLASNTDLIDSLTHGFTATAASQSGDDLNAWREPGIYGTLASANIANGPGFSAAAYIIVFKYDNGPNNGNTGSVTQIAVGYRSLQIAIRYYNASASTWSDWGVFQ